MQPRLVFGENIAHTAQMVESGAANVGIIALSQASFPSLAKHPFHLIDDGLHNPLTQAFVVTRHAGNNEAAQIFARFMETDEAHEIMELYGFVIGMAERLGMMNRRLNKLGLDPLDELGRDG